MSEPPFQTFDIEKMIYALCIQSWMAEDGSISEISIGDIKAFRLAFADISLVPTDVRTPVLIQNRNSYEYWTRAVVNFQTETQWGINFGLNAISLSNRLSIQRNQALEGTISLWIDPQMNRTAEKDYLFAYSWRVIEIKEVDTQTAAGRDIRKLVWGYPYTSLSSFVLVCELLGKCDTTIS